MSRQTVADEDVRVENAPVTRTSNAYCDALGIRPPAVEDAMSSTDANYYSLLLVALLEHGAPMTLPQVAARFEAAGVAPAPDALASLERCKPGRAPIYRDGDSYALDPHDDEVGFWLFRLGLRPPRVAPLQAVPPPAGPLPAPDQPLTVAALDEAWRDGVPSAWSAQRVAVAVLDAHDAAMSGAEVMAFVSARSRWSPLRPDSAQYWRSGAITVREDGRWVLDRAHDVVRSAREAVRDRLSDTRRWGAQRPDPLALEAHRQRLERERQAHAEELAAMRRVLLHAFPAARPQAVVLDRCSGTRGDHLHRRRDRAGEDPAGRVRHHRRGRRSAAASGPERRTRRAPAGRTGTAAEDPTAQPTGPDACHHDDAAGAGHVWDQPSVRG